VSTIKPSYPASGTAVTITLASLASGSARASTAIDNTTNLNVDYRVQIKAKTGASGTSATGYMNWYIVDSTDGGTTYGEGATGSDAAITLTVPTNAKLLATTNMVTNATTYIGDGGSVAALFNGNCPKKFAVVASNQTGHALDATGTNFVVQCESIQYTSA